ncbi:MAG: DUF1015 domain-containing protein [Candidatus Hydrogenedentota bacterium]
MLTVQAFQGYRFGPDVVRKIDEVITPPFDVITSEQRALLAARSPNNMVHVILPEARGEGDKYDDAARDLKRRLDGNVLIQDNVPSFYVLEQTFRDIDGREHKRRAFYALTKLPEPGEETVLGHERTFAHKIQDRLALTRATRTYFGAVFVMYNDESNELGFVYDAIRQGEALLEAHTIDGVTQRMWRIDDDPRVTAFFRDKTLYIADGHHRYATALAYRDEMRVRNNGAPGPYDYIMMGFVSFQDPGLLVYPAHRVCDQPDGMSFDALRSRLNEYFDVVPANGDLAQRVRFEPGCVFGLAARGAGHHLLRLRDVDRADWLGNDHGPAWRDLDVAVLHRGVLEQLVGLPEGAELIYEPDAQKAVAYADRGEKGLAFLTKPATPQQIRACADAGEYMPQKATYLYPKLPTGPVIYRMA